MPSTSNYSLRYPDSGDSASGPAHLGNLANDIEAAVDAALTSTAVMVELRDMDYVRPVVVRTWATPSKLTNPGTLPAGTGYGTAWSPDGRFLSVAHGTTPYITIYERSGTTFTKLTNPGTLPLSTGYGTAWSPDGRFLSVAHPSSPYITIYERSGTTFTKLTDPGTLPTDTGRGTAWSPDGRFLSVAHYNSPYITIYQTSGSTPTGVTLPISIQD